MAAVQFIRWSGLAAVLGGLLWSVAAVLHSQEPVGCIAEQCLTRPMRETSGVVSAMTLAGTLLIGLGTAGLVVLLRHAGRFGRTARRGAILGVAGLIVMVLAALVQAVFFNGDFPLMPYFLLPGGLAAIAGFLMIGIAVLRGRVLPRWAGILLAVTSVLMLAFNEQTYAVLLGIPFGIAWIAVGLVLWRRGARHAGNDSTPSATSSF